MSKSPEITPEYVAELERRMVQMEARTAEIEAANQQLEAHLKVSEMLRTDLERMLKHERRARWGATSEKLGDSRNSFDHV